LSVFYFGIVWVAGVAGVWFNGIVVRVEQYGGLGRIKMFVPCPYIIELAVGFNAVLLKTLSIRSAVRSSSLLNDGIEMSCCSSCKASCDNADISAIDYRGLYP
jgi:hypothetical protein